MRGGGGAVKEQGERRMQRTPLDKAPECPPSLARPSLGDSKRFRVQPLPLVDRLSPGTGHCITEVCFLI